MSPASSNIRRTVLLSLAFTLAIALPAHEAEAKKTSWKQVWNDEFDGIALDKTKWTAEDAALVKNNELQYYSPDEVYVRSGLLTLRSRRQAMGGRQFTSGLVETHGKFKLLYGRVEIRAKLPKGQGIWPAHWMMPDDNSWPPEIDIMELLGHRPDKVHFNVHYSTKSGARSHGESFVGPDFSKKFHVFAVEWEPEEIRWYVDGKLRFSTRQHVPKVPMRIILNTAVGGNWPGNPTKKTPFPQYHEIDYVRVYAKESQ